MAKWATNHQRRYSSDQRYRKRCSTSPIIRKMQIKATVRYRITITKNTRGNKCWWGCGEKGILVHCYWECKFVVLYKTVWSFLQKWKIKLLYNPAISLLGIYPKEVKSLSQRDICISLFIAAFFLNSQVMETT